MNQCITNQNTAELLAETAAAEYKEARLILKVDASPLRRALRAHFERFGGVLESKTLAAGEDAIYKDTARRAVGGKQ
jgi:hypothetical protein